LKNVFDFGDFQKYQFEFDDNVQSVQLIFFNKHIFRTTEKASPSPTLCCAGEGVIVALFIPLPWLWF
jgi:hypothetical protein